jgi:RNA polymerase sigma-70 factor (ECF subfamily)
MPATDTVAPSPVTVVTSGPPSPRPDGLQPSDEDLVNDVRAGHLASFEVLMRRYNQRLFRVARAVVRDDDEAQDVAQQAYVNAYLHLDQFESRARFSTWLTRIAIHEAISRARRAGRWEASDADAGGESAMDHIRSPGHDPEQGAYHAELSTLIERATGRLPDTLRSVFVLRDVEEMSTAETAEHLGLKEETVKTRLHRARAQMRRMLDADVGASARTAFQFQGPRCDRMVAEVMARLAALGAGPV